MCLEPSYATVQHSNVDETTTSYAAERNKLCNKVYRDEVNNITRLEHQMLPYESKITFNKSTNIDYWNSQEVENEDDQARMARLGYGAKPADDDKAERDDGFFCIDNAEKKIYTDMETFEFGPSDMRHRLFVGPDSEGNSRLFIQKFSTDSMSWVGADVVVDQYLEHTSEITFEATFVAKQDHQDYSGDIEVKITRLTGPVDYVHIHLDDNRAEGSTYKIIRTEVTTKATDENKIVISLVDNQNNYVDFTLKVVDDVTNAVDSSAIEADSFITITSASFSKIDGTYIIRSVDTANHTIEVRKENVTSDELTELSGLGTCGPRRW